MTYNYVWFLIDAMRKNGNVMTEDMIEDMKLAEDETDEYVQRFLEKLAEGTEAHEKEK